MNIDIVIHGIETGWKQALGNEFNKTYFQELKGKLLIEKKNYTILPNEKDIFSALDLTPFNEVKVIIIGQDPYHGAGQANGLCFSVSGNINHPPSLKNIFKEIQRDLKIPYPKNGNLESWAKQGVLLLNASLSVRKDQANSHSDFGWQIFTDEVIKQLSSQKKDLIFLLWGGFAKKKMKLINKENHHILTSGHPSPLSANRDHWFGNGHFHKTNELLISLNKEPIDWRIE
jgi:uracil-DNA glycosylase